MERNYLLKRLSGSLFQQGGHLPLQEIIKPRILCSMKRQDLVTPFMNILIPASEQKWRLIPVQEKQQC